MHPIITFSQSVREELFARYSAGNAPRVHQLKGGLNDCKQGSDTVVEYYTRLKSTLDELGNYSKIKNCTCGAAASIAKEREEEKVHQFLMGLDSKLYGNVRTTLLMEEHIVTLIRAYAIVLREERHASMTKVKDDKIEAAMAVQSSGGYGSGWNRKGENDESNAPSQCTYCGKYYHTEDNCYSKHDFVAVRGSCVRGGRGRGKCRNQDQHQANAVGLSNKLKGYEHHAIDFCLHK